MRVSVKSWRAVNVCLQLGVSHPLGWLESCVQDMRTGKCTFTFLIKKVTENRLVTDRVTVGHANLMSCLCVNERMFSSGDSVAVLSLCCSVEFVLQC